MKNSHVGSHFVSGDVKQRPPGIETYQYLYKPKISSFLFLALHDPGRRPSRFLIAGTNTWFNLWNPLLVSRR